MKNSSLSRNIIYSSIYQILTIITPLITAPYLSRVLGPAGIGQYNYSLACANFFFLIAMLGVNNYGNRSIAQAREDKVKVSKIFWEIYGLQLLLSVICTVTYVLFSCFLFSGEERFIFLIQGMVVFAATTDINWFAFGLEKFKYTTVRNIIIKLFTLGCIFLFVNTRNDTWIYIFVTEFGIIMGLLVLWPLVKKELYFIRPTLKGVFQHLRPNLVLFLPLLATSIYQYVDKIMLGIYMSDEIVGYYAYAESILNIPLGLINAVCTVAMPRITNLLSNDNKTDADEIYKKGLFLTSVLEIAIFWGILAISEKFIPLYLGEEFIETAYILKLLAIVVILLGTANVVRMMCLIPKGMDKLYSVSIILGCVGNIIGNILLIPKNGYVGACISTIVAYFIVDLIQIIGSRKILNYGKLFVCLIPFGFLGFFMYMVIKVIDKAILCNPLFLMVVEITTGLIIYSGGCIFAMYINKRILRKRL